VKTTADVLREYEKKAMGIEVNKGTSMISKSRGKT
jgi:hypothetical protein